MRLSFKTRINIVYFCAALAAAVIIARLFFIQVVRNDHYQSLANQQYAASFLENFDRGTIYFTEKNGNIISAATVKKGYQTAINPKALKNPEDAYFKLSAIIPTDKNFFMNKAFKKNDPYEIVAKHIDETTAVKIKSLKITGLSAYPESWRYYPFDNLGSHVIGFVGYKDDKLSGRYGLEMSYENLLKRDVSSVVSNSFAELFFDLKNLVVGDISGGDLILTIEPTVQTALEKNLEKIKEKYKAQTVGGVIISPKTGEIIAMSGKPDFNPNQYAKIKDFSAFMNPTVESVFEMGSIMKPLTLAAAIDNGSITADTEYVDRGFVDFGIARIKNHNGVARGKVNMQKVINESLNTGAVFAMQELGKDKFRDYMLKYGFGEKTGIELPQEAGNKIANIINNNRDVEYATASFGQGIAVTPIAMVQALSSLANGGLIMKPHIVKEESVRHLKNKIKEPQELRRVLKKETSETMSRMLVNAVDNALMGGAYKMEHYSVAAKTGTAQLVDGKGGYMDNEFVHTFFGYAPAFDAKFLILLFVSKPKGARYASDTLAGPFMDTTKFLLNYYEIPPDR